MPRALGRLPFFRRGGSGRDGTDRVEPAPARPIDLDAAPVGPPLLLPAAIIRQILYEATELTPAWALPRATTTSAIVATPSATGPAVATAPDEVTPAARSRRASPGTTPKSKRPRPTASTAPPPDAGATPRRSGRTKKAG